MAANGQEAVLSAREHRPDLVLMDVTMPNHAAAVAAATKRSSVNGIFPNSSVKGSRDSITPYKLTA